MYQTNQSISYTNWNGTCNILLILHERPVCIDEDEWYFYYNFFYLDTWFGLLAMWEVEEIICIRFIYEYQNFTTVQIFNYCPRDDVLCEDVQFKTFSKYRLMTKVFIIIDDNNQLHVGQV